ncbi:Inner membrane symporter YicJ [Limihaloglobus sulfuriphilus]|uniref:Inner membrane symporter YicJ n=1 Tax=Limihaloglobus sulfuriphilus TaxID=1851148 RepID=A0A1Q2MBH6_9BACT|nr:glycoside-pentoside-hexuronide (GPH):cation symporter [Limihaloglobus sulfuriphilus]AQQ70024.1 Inner membrane symporter YicJ [Limihaloglobus sulfuriphilus]
MISGNKNDKVSVIEKIGYGLGDTASNIVFQTVMLLLAYFYTDIFGISAAAMGTLFLSVRILDAVTDPLMGAVCDRTNTRWGKFRPYIFLLSVPFAVICVVTFTTPQFSPAGKLIYAYITYSLLMIIYTAINIPYCALGGVITSDSQERVSLNSYRFVLATAGGVIVASCTLPLVRLLGQGNEQKGYQLAMTVFGVFAVVMFLACFFLTKERVFAVSEKKTGILTDIRLIFSNDQWLLIAVLTFMLLISLVLRGSCAAYYIKWYAGRPDLITAFLTTGMVASMIGAAFAASLTRRMPKSKVYILIQISIALVSACMFFVGPANLALIFILFFIVQFFVQMGSPILWAMMADCVEYGELKTGRRVTGLVFSGALFTLKLGMALGGAILGWLLAYFGYQEKADMQTEEAIRGIVLIFTLIPAIGHILVIGIVSRYKLTDDKCRQIRIELENRRVDTHQDI